jgi:hypothetical protein
LTTLQGAIEPDVFAPEDVPEEEEERRAYRLRDKGAADWALRSLAKIRSKRAERMDLWKAEQARLAEWYERGDDPLDRDEHFFVDLLRMFHEDQFRADPKAKTIDLPGGTLKSRSGNATVEVVDEVSFLAWAKENKPELVETIERPATKTAILKVVEGGQFNESRHEVLDEPLIVPAATRDGEIIPGVELRVSGRTFGIKVGE